MRIRFNGQEQAVDKETSLFDFLKSREIDPKAGYIAIALNETIAKRTEWTRLILQEGDRIELIQAVQGG